MNPFPPKNILVALDGSPCSHVAWLHAKELKKSFGCGIQAIFVRQLHRALAFADFPYDAVASIQRKTAKELRSWVGKDGDYKVLRGEAASVILETAAKGKYDLIVLGTHGRKGMDRLILGSVAETVVRGSKIPVLVIQKKPAPIKSVLAPVKFTEYCKAGFKFAVEAAGAYEAQLVALHVAPNWENMDEIDSQFDDLMRLVPGGIEKHGKMERFLETGPSPVREILSEARYHQLVVITAHRKRLLESWVLGNTAERVLRYSPVPVLVMPWSPIPKSIKIKASEKQTVDGVKN